MGKIYLKILIPSIISILLFALTIFGFIIPHFKENVMNGKREMIRELTNSAWSILSKYESDERNGLISREEAQNTAVSRIEYLRYGPEHMDYFWITDRHPMMIMHPYRKDLNGKDLSNFTDPQGTRLFVEFVKTVHQSGSGYVNYMWQEKADSLHIVPKLSYVKLFEPWGWIIGTGVYVEDVKQEIKALTKRLIWISAGISGIIALLLLFISQQSIQTEMKRAEAEKELHESKEKYRTLVEASTEGLVLLSEGKISYVNDVFCKMTGYADTELRQLLFRDIIQENNGRLIHEAFNDSRVLKEQNEIVFKKKNGGTVETLAVSSAGMINGKAVNIIIIRDITIDRNSDLTVLDYKKLLNTRNIGFFRAGIDEKEKFVYANETAVRILGYDNFSQLSEMHIFHLLTDQEERRNLKKELLQNGYISDKIIKIQKKDKESAFLSVTLDLYIDESTRDSFCDGMIEDVTVSETEKQEVFDLIARLKQSNFMIEQPVKDFLSPVHTFDADSTISLAIKELSIRGSDNLLLTKNEKDVIGIVTDNDIRHRVLRLHLQPDNPTYLIMTSPVVSVNENIPVNEAIRICQEKNINHLVTKNHSGEISGVFKTKEIYSRLKDSLLFYVSAVEKAETTGQIKQAYRQLQQLVNPLIKSESSVKYITAITSSFTDAVIRRLVDTAVNELGNPPAAFSFMCLGSEGRGEETLLTDQDNAIIYEEVLPDREKNADTYFRRLGEKVCNSLYDVGYAYCKGNIMAKNPQWCQPVSQWKKYFAGWIVAPEPQNLLDATVFFDFRNVCGDDIFASQLRNTIREHLPGHALFLYHLAREAYQIKIPHLSSPAILSDRSADMIDLKHILSFYVRFARVYSLQHNILQTNTLERLDALKGHNIISDNLIDEIKFGYNFLMKLRFRNQTNLAENHLPLSNHLNIKFLVNTEISILKEILSSIPGYQRIMASDFRISD